MIYIFSKKGTYYNRVDIKTENGKLGERGSNRGAKVYNQTKYEGNTTYTTDRCALSVINIKNYARPGQHPTEKPKELYEWLLRRYCPAEGTILDPTAGSFNSVSVALSLGMNAIGIEKDEGFFNKGFEMLCKESE
jgi:DNA modification methylase